MGEVRSIGADGAAGRDLAASRDVDVTMEEVETTGVRLVPVETIVASE